MTTISASIHDLIQILRKNLEQHKIDYAEAVLGYNTELREAMLSKIKSIEKDKTIPVPTHFANIVQPISYTKDYERIIKMLEMHMPSTIDLDEHDYHRYVEDNWDWRQNWYDSNSKYLSNIAK